MKTTMKAERVLTGTAPKRRVFTREEQIRAAQTKAKPESKEVDVSNVSRASRHA